MIGGVSAAVPTDGLVSWWRFDGDVVDSMGTNNGTLTGGAQVSDGVLVLDGDGDYVYIGEPASLEFNNKKELTISAWVNPSETKRMSVLNDGWEYEAIILESAGKARTHFYSYDGTTYTGENIYMGSDYSINTWTFVAMTVDFNTGVARLYQNDEVVELPLDISERMYSPPGNQLMYIGGYQYTGGSPYVVGDFFNGSIDDVMIYNQSLSALEISAIYNSQMKSDCSDDNTLLKLSPATNAHGALWNDTNYDYDICYGGVAPAISHPECTAINSFLWLSSVDNAHASITETVDYATGVCYGDLSCAVEVISVAGNNCSDGSVPILSLYSGTNSHMAAGNFDGYNTKICCGVIVMNNLHWADANGVPLEGKEPNIGDTVRAVKTLASSGIFNVSEEDVWPNPNDEIISIDGEDIDGNLVGKWVITEAGLLGKTSDYDDFYFNVDGVGEKSDKLSINETYDNSPTEVTIVSPACGSDYSKGAEVTIKIDADDDDDVINGNVSVNGVVVPEGAFENGLSSFNRTFSLAGNYQIMAEATVSRPDGSIDRAKHISNIMIVDVNVTGSKYVAACIDYPKNYDVIEESLVNFSAESTRAIEVSSSGVKNVILPGSARFSWYWRFIAPNSQINDIVREFSNDDTLLAYKFSVQFPVAGDNSATLQVDFN